MSQRVEQRPIEGFPGYVVTSDGRVLSFHNWRGEMPHVMAAHPDRYGYLKVHLKRGESESSRHVHRIVCAAFHGPKSNRKAQVRHLDGNRQNNAAANLCWGTAKENAEDRERHGTTARGERNGFAVLSDADVSAAQHLLNIGFPAEPMAAWLGVDQTTLLSRMKSMPPEHAAPALISAARENASLRVQVERLRSRNATLEEIDDSSLQEAISCGRQAERLKWETENASLKERVKKAEDLNKYFRDGVGECHVMISRNTSEFQIRKEWDPTDLPPRLQKVMQRAEAAEQRASDLKLRAEAAEAKVEYLHECYERAESDVNRHSRERHDAEQRADEAEREAARWKAAHDGILAEAARMCEEAKRGADEAGQKLGEAAREIAEQASRETAWARKFDEQIEHFAIRRDNERRRLLLKWRVDRKRLMSKLFVSEKAREEAEKDSKRLDWLSRNDVIQQEVGSDGWRLPKSDFREAIDAAMSQEQQ